jgi:hypothetical protein
MSEQQPPSESPYEMQGGTPEYLDYGSGAPIPPDPAGAAPSGRRSRRTPLLVGGGVVGLLALGAGAWAALSFFQQGAQPAEALPASTIAYASIDLDPSGGQKIDAFRTLEKFPAFKDQVGIHSVDDVRRKIGEELISASGCELSYDADIAPWLGDRAAVAAVDVGDSQPAPVLVVQAKDDAKADAGMHTLLTCGGTPPSDVAYDVHDGWVIMSKTQDDVSKVEAATAKGSLADDATYQKWTKAVGDAGVVNLYAAPAAGDYLAGQLGNLQDAFGGYGLASGSEGFGYDDAVPGAAPSASASTVTSGFSTTYRASAPQDAADPFGGVLKNFQGAAATIRFTGDGLELATATDPGLSQSDLAGDQGGAVVSRLPADTAAALGISLKPGWVLSLADRFASYSGDGKTGQDLLDQLSKESGLALPADAETLLGTSSAVSISKTFDYEAMVQSSDPAGVPVAFTVRGDPAAIERVLDKIRHQAGSDPASVALLGSDSSGGLVVVGPTPAYRQAILAGGSLGGTAAFQSVVPEAGHASQVLYVNVDDLEHAISQAAAGDHSVLDNVSPLQAIGFSTWTDGDALHSSLKISTN